DRESNCDESWEQLPLGSSEPGEQPAVDRVLRRRAEIVAPRRAAVHHLRLGAVAYDASGIEIRACQRKGHNCGNRGGDGECCSDPRQPRTPWMVDARPDTIAMRDHDSTNNRDVRDQEQSVVHARQNLSRREYAEPCAVAEA